MADVAGPAYPQHNRRDQLVELFPEYDIDLILESLPNHFSAEAVADWILTNENNAPRKRKAQKRKAERQMSSDDEELSDEDENIEGLVLNKLLKELYSKYSINEAQPILKHEIKSLIGSFFPKIRMDFITKAYSHSKDICSTMIASWFVANKCTQKLQEFMNNPENIMWVTTDPIHNKRKHRSLDQEEDEYFNFIDMTGGIVKFKEIMRNLSNRYPQILKGTQLLNEAFTLKIEIPEGIEMFECGVCFTEKTIDKRIMCGNAESETRHSFCRTCLRGHASAAAEDMPLAEGAVGLKCMEFKCMNAIYYSTIRSLIPKEIRERIDNRILEENLGQAGLNLESCEELDEKNNVDRKRRKLEERLNEVVVRKCGKCGLQMIKLDGCNKMTCRCEATMCYVCKKQNINYEHFCRHVRVPGVNNCDLCLENTCTLWEDAQKKDNEEIERIQREEGVLVDHPGTPDTEQERITARNGREVQINQRFQIPPVIRHDFGQEGQDNNRALLQALEGLNQPVYPLYPMINVQIGHGQPQNFGFNPMLNNNQGQQNGQNVPILPLREQPRFIPPLVPIPPRIDQPFAQRQEVNENFNVNNEGEGNHFNGFNGNMLNLYGRNMRNFNNGLFNFEQRRVQQELERVNQMNRGERNWMPFPLPRLPMLGGGQNIPNAVIQGPLEHREPERINNQGENGGILDALARFEQNAVIPRYGNEMNEVNRGFNQFRNNEVDEQREESDSDESDNSINVESEIELSDDDEPIVLGRTSPVRRQPKRSSIQLAVDRLSDGAPAYELVPLGLPNFEKSFNELVNDCNSVANFSANDCTQAADIFTRNFVISHPECEEEAQLFREFSNAQNEFAQMAKRHQANNQVFTERLEELKRNRNQRNQDQNNGNQVNAVDSPANNPIRQNPPKVEDRDHDELPDEQVNYRVNYELMNQVDNLIDAPFLAL
ncbi:hypothetical protein FO519_008093 [Halicephalobus sp. NKZ332]|nr:hypothetical protein FO519_008093 [Halicephalobus sp. NKZ332]